MFGCLTRLSMDTSLARARACLEELLFFAILTATGVAPNRRPLRTDPKPPSPMTSYSWIPSDWSSQSSPRTCTISSMSAALTKTSGDLKSAFGASCTSSSGGTCCGSITAFSTVFCSGKRPLQVRQARIPRQTETKMPETAKAIGKKVAVSSWRTPWRCMSRTSALRSNPRNVKTPMFPPYANAASLQEITSCSGKSLAGHRIQSPSISTPTSKRS
mmetsp:Transcript_86419/g.241774  ORF Transcript_86419/g.241774 Transcript_86419/m.241774 type:complete len:216 (+) Transcript_86419:980-1627(+)